MKIKLLTLVIATTVQFMASANDSHLLDRFFSTESYDSVLYYFEKLDQKDRILSDINGVKRYEKACYYTAKTYPALKFLEKVEPYVHTYTIEDKYWYYITAGMYAWESEFLDQALSYYFKAKPIGENLHGSSSEEFAKLLLDFGTVYHFMGNYSEATDYFTKSRDTYGLALGENSHRFHYVNSLITQVQFISSPNEQTFHLLVSQLKIAIKLAKDYPSEIRRNFWSTRHLSVLVNSFLEMKMPDSAEYYLNQITHNPRGELGLAKVKIYQQNGNYPEALDYMESIISDFSGWGFDKSRRMADMFAILGDLHKQNGNIQEAVYQYDSAIVLLTGEVSVDQLYINKVNCHNLWPDESLYRVLKKRIDLFQFIDGDSSDTMILHEQMKYYQFLVNYINSCLSRFISDRSKLHWASRTDDTYEKALNTALRLYEITNDRSYFLEALLLANKRKYRLVTEHLKQVNVAERLNIPDSIRLAEIAAYEGLDRSMRSNNYDDLQKNEQRLCSIQAKYKSDYNLAWRLKSDVLYNGDEHFFEIIDEKTALIQTVTQQDELIILYHSKKEDKVLTIDRQSGEALVSRYLSNLRQKETDWEPNSSKLFTTLLEPILSPADSITNLVIIPDGLLSLVPFESLLIDNVKRKFLLEAYNIRYSLNMLWPESQKRETTSLSAFAPKSDLKYHISEVREIGKLTHGNVWIGEDATISRFKEESRTRKVIHLATHFKYDTEDYLDSYLDFGISENKSARLSMSDIMLFQVNADLIVLSACETGIGELIKGEGAMSIGRSFAYSGAPNVVMSLWKVPDQSTMDLMADFYTYLHDGNSYESALRKAKLNYLQTSDNLTSHPYYWSSMIFLGSDGKLESEDRSFMYKLIFGFALIIALLLAVRFNRS